MSVRKKKPCPKKPDTYKDDECETLDISCFERSTDGGNILDRIVYCPTQFREPGLKKWPTMCLDSEDVDDNNPNQLKSSMKTTMLNHMASLKVESMPSSFRQPAIIGTIGPSCMAVEDILQLIDAGMNVGRINMAHIDPCSTVTYIQNVIEASNRYSTEVDFLIPIATMMDLKGPEIRTGMISSIYSHEGCLKVDIEKGQRITLTTDSDYENSCNNKIIYVDYEGLPLHVQPGMNIYISGKDMCLEVNDVDGSRILCTVVAGGVLKNYQPLFIPMLPMILPAITEYDWKCLNLAVECGVDIVVVPRTKNEEIIYKVKSFFEEKNLEQRILVFAKISNYEGLTNIDKIITAADGIVIQKNELVLEITRTKIFVAQKEIIAKCNKVGKPVVCCVEMCCGSTELAQYIIDGADCLLLTVETALGNQGACDVEILGQIMREADAAAMKTLHFNDMSESLTPSIEPSLAIALAAVSVANKIQAAAILTITTSGKTAQLLSLFRPRCPVIAVTRYGRTARQMNMWRSILPLQYTGPLENDWFEDCGSRIRYGIAYGKEKGIITPGDPLVLVTGYRKQAGFTNCLRVVFASLKEGHVDNPRQFIAQS